MAKRKKKITKGVTSPAAKRKKKKSTVQSQNTKKIRPSLLAFIAVAITLVLFIPSIGNDFVNWDDDRNLYENENTNGLNSEHIKNIFTTDVIGNYNPLPILTFAVEREFFGLNPTIFHITNLVLHLLCVLLVFRILMLWRLKPLWAFIGALLFGFHPMRVESVAWVTERKDVLFGVFFLAAIWQYLQWIRKEDKKMWRYIFILILFVLSLLSKIQAVALPLALLTIDYWMDRPIQWKLIIEKIPHFLLALVTGLLGISMLQSQGSIDGSADIFGFVDRIFIASFSLFTYLYKLIIPYPLSPLYPYPAALEWYHYASILLPFGVLGLLIWSFKKIKPVFFGLTFFLVNVVFVLQLVGAGQAYLADRFTYMAYLGLFFIICWYLQKWTGTNIQYQSVAIGGSVLVLAILAVISFNQIKIWKNGETLWTHVLKYHDDTPLPYGNRGYYYREQDEFLKSIEDYTKAIELKPDAANYYNSRGKSFFDMGNASQSLNDFNMAIRYDKATAEYYINRGGAFAAANQLNKALDDFNQGLALNPDYANGYLNRSLLYFNIGRFELALQDYDSYLNLNPSNAEIWYERGLVKRQLKRSREALIDVTQAIQLNPNDPKYYVERARLYKIFQNPAAMQQDIQQAKALGGTIPTDL